MRTQTFTFGLLFMAFASGSCGKVVDRTLTDSDTLGASGADAAATGGGEGGSSAGGSGARASGSSGRATASGGSTAKGGSSSSGGSSGTGGDGTPGAGGDTTQAGQGGETGAGGSVSTAGRPGTGGSTGTGGSSAGGSGGKGTGAIGGSSGMGSAGRPGTGGTGGSGTGGSGTGGSGTGGSGTGGTSSAGTGGTGGTGGSGTGGTSSAGTGGTGGMGGSGTGGTSSAGTGGTGGTGGSSTGDPLNSCGTTTMPATGGTVHSSSNQQGTAGALSWSIWSNSTQGSITTYTTPAFSASWNNSGDFLARLGLQWNSSHTYDYYGTITAQFSSTKTGTAGGYSYIGVYGWSVSPCIEWYIVEDSFQTMPVNPGNTTLKATVTIDGGTYKLFTRATTGTGGSVCAGVSSWNQFYSVRTTARHCGQISLSAHFDAWKNAGMNLGNMEEAKILVETGGGTGSINFPVADMTTTQ